MIVLHPVHGYRIRPQEDLKTIKRNARERNRVQTVNQGFEKLRLHIPSAACDKKMSKVNILGHAVNYIQCLHAMIQSQQQHLLHNTNPNSNGLPQSPGVSSTSDYFSSPDVSFNVSASAQLSSFPDDFSAMSTPFSNSFGSLPTPNSNNGSCYSPHTPFTPHSPFTPLHSSQSYSGHQHQQNHFSFPAASSPVQQQQQRQLFNHMGPLHVARAQEEDTSEGEDDILDAIVEWQDHTPADIS
jgi:hypothetical protein